MNVEIVEKDRKSIELRISGEGHTLFNALRKILFEDKDVSFAGYDVEHPMLGSTKFFLRVKGRKGVTTVLSEAVEKLIKRAKELRKKFEESLIE